MNPGNQLHTKGLDCTIASMESEPGATPDVSTIPISEFRRRCLSLLPAMAESGGEIIVTRRGKPLAVVSPIRHGGSGSIFGLYSKGDIVYPDPTAPYYSDDEWDEIVDGWDADTS